MDTDLMIKLGGYITLALIAASGGFYVEHLRFEAYKDQVEIAAKNQQIKNDVINTEREHVSTNIKDDYVDKLNNINAYYDSLRPNTDSCPMPSAADTASRTHASSSDSLSAQCAKTTLMLVELQQWVRDESNTYD